MNKSFVLFIMTVTLASHAGAQRKDTVLLKEIEVYGMPLSRYSSGTKVDRIQNTGESPLLYKALADETTAYFKTYGNNQLATIAFRGTSASHTAVLWNGININSPSLGQTDFSLLPTFLMEDIAVQYGTASSMYGSDALGGSVILAQAAPRFEKGMRLQYHQQIGSFGRNFSGAKLVWGNDRFEFRTKAFSSFIKNNFSYDAPAVGYAKRQNDASVTNYGLDQQVHFQISPRQQLSFEGMYTYNLRNIQPTVTNDQPAGTLKDENTRLSFSYQNDSGMGRLHATAGYIVNNEVYNINSVTRTNQINFLVNVDLPVGSKSNLRYGVNAAKYFARADNYPGNFSEERYDGFFSFRHQINPFWNVSINLRQSIYAHRYAPFAPSIGSEVRIINNAQHKLLFRSQGSRGYRVPTLNDRYWTPGGNPNLKPEDALHVETGLAWTHFMAKREMKLDITAFETWTNQWIIWLPGNNGIWSPSNLQKVNAYGVEASARYAWTNVTFPTQIGVNYGYTRSINQHGLNEFDQSSIGKQLPYVPMHIANGFIKIRHQNWAGQVRLNYTSLRYLTFDNEVKESLAAYVLMDMAVARSLEFNAVMLQVRAEVNNIFNTYYENVKSNAMPGRNYAVHVTINFKTKPRS